MTLFPRRTHLIGIETLPSLVRIAHLKKGLKGWEKPQLKELLHVNPLYNIAEGATLVSAIASKDVLIRNLEVPLKKEKHIAKALDFLVEPLLPYPPERGVIQFDVIDKKVAGSVLTAYAVKKEHVQAHLSNIRCHPDVITSKPYALAMLSHHFDHPKTPFLLIHVGEEEVTCICVENGKLLAARAFEKTLSFHSEIKKTLLKFFATHKNIETIFYLGEEENSHINELKKLSEKSVLFPSINSFEISKSDLIRFGLAIGIALSASGPNFRQKEFAHAFLMKKIKKPLVLTGCFVALLLGVLITGGHLWVKQEQKKVEEGFFSLSKLIDGSSEKKYEAPSEYQNALEALEQNLEKRSEIHPLIPQIPKVKDFLAWLSLLPFDPGIEIQNLHYFVEKYPSLGQKNETYKVRVELELSSQKPHSFQLAHELLTAPNHFINPKEDFKWNVTKDRARAIFYLKDKTKYT